MEPGSNNLLMFQDKSARSAEPITCVSTAIMSLGETKPQSPLLDNFGVTKQILDLIAPPTHSIEVQIRCAELHPFFIVGTSPRL